MTLTPDQIRSWNLEPLENIAQSWSTLGGRIDELFDEYVGAVTKVGDHYWEGRTAEAAQDHARRDRKTAGYVVDQLNGLGTVLTNGFHGIDGPLRKARAALAEATSEGFDVGPDLQVTFTGDASSLTPARRAALDRLTHDLPYYASVVEQADNALAAAIGTESDTLRGVFTSQATLGFDAARSDGQFLANHPEQLTPEMLRRIVDAGTLTPDQLAALHNGAPVMLSASQMSYMDELARSLDGKSPQQIRQIMDAMPPDAQAALSQSFQIMSSKNVTTGLDTQAAAAAGIPASGGKDMLPSGIEKSLSRTDLTSYECSFPDYVHRYTFNGVADTDAITAIVGKGDPKYRQGSALDTQLLDVGRQYLHQQVRVEQDRALMGTNVAVDGEHNTISSMGKPDEVADTIFRTIGPDKAAVENVLSNTTDNDGGTFVRDLLAHRSTDGGAAAATLFDFPDHTADPVNPNDPAQHVDATRMAHIMSMVGQNVSGNGDWDLFKNVPNTDGQSAGQLNPELVRSLSNSMSPFMSDLSGGGKHDGFDLGADPTHPWTDPDGNLSFRGAANVFALMNTDHDAGQHFIGAAQAEITANHWEFAKDPTVNTGLYHLQAIGTLNGLVDKGLAQSTASDHLNAFDRAKEIYETKTEAYDAAKGLIAARIGMYKPESFPNAGAWGKGIADATNDPLKSLVVGPAPQLAATEPKPVPDFNGDSYEVLRDRQAMGLPLPPDAQQRYPFAFDRNGNLKPYADGIRDAPAYQDRNAYGEMLQQLGGGNGWQSMMDSYYLVMPTPSSTQPGE